ncbi:DnaB helicase-like protein [Micromonospora pisi]|uniref:DnaB helicase-like protein n=1 Tax=Micromonospora pisi TaxID=589240 RepID=A0A495JHW7_9ACTN|nr:DnaB-like helicase N-terminal domain-containing protein [Micromonospora pisi]RKR88371.1 DnaB helicase-like protein [Micromonospora pisi]
MSDLIMRAEQGILGALLADRDQALITEHLNTEDFGHPAHQAIYTAILDLQTAGYATEQVTATIVEMVDRPDVDAAWLQALAINAPGSDRLRAYTQIVIQAAFDRDIADFADPYLDAAALASNPEARDNLTRLGQALTVQADTFAPGSTIDPDRSVQVTSLTTVATAVELHREDAVIADLVQHPEQARAVAGWLTPEVFTTEQRRLTYEFAVSIAYDNDPIDAVILAWHVQRARDINNMYDHETRLPDPRNESEYAYLTRLEVTTVAVGTAVMVGHQLVFEHVTATLALSATTAAEHAIQATPAQRGEHHIGLEPPTTPTPTVDVRRIEL